MPDAYDDNELAIVTAYTSYQWDCPHCGDVNSEDPDPQGEEVQCGSCGEYVYVEYTL
jgi:transcription elongation factor Elf1